MIEVLGLIRKFRTFRLLSLHNQVQLILNVAIGHDIL